MSLIVLKDATCGRGISVAVPQLDPFGRPLTPESASLLRTEQARHVPGKLIAIAIALLVAGAVAAAVVLALHADPAPVRVPDQLVKAPPPPAPKLLAPRAFSQAFFAALTEADKHPHGGLDSVSITARELELQFQPKHHKRLFVTVTNGGAASSSTMEEQKTYTHAFS